MPTRQLTLHGYSWRKSPVEVDALHNGLPPVLWSILVVGGLATVIFTYFF